MAIDDIVDMVAVRNCLMSTLSAVGMARVVSGARMGRRAASRIRLARGENVLVNVSLVEMMQVPVVKIILVAIVFDGLVPAVGPVLMIVSVVYRVIRFHRSLSLSPASSLGERCSWPYARAVTLCVVSIERRSTSLAAVSFARTRHDHPGSMSTHHVADISRHFVPIAAIVLVRGRRQRYESPCDAVEVVCTLARSRTAESGPNESRSNSRERPRR